MITTGFSPELLRRDADPSPSDDTHRKKKRAEGLFFVYVCRVSIADRLQSRENVIKKP